MSSGPINGDKPVFVSFVAPKTIESAWKYCEHMLAKAVKHARGELDMEDVRKECLENNMQLWMVFTAEPEFLGAAVTQLVQYPRLKAVRIVLLGGKDFVSWKLKLDQELCEFARREGCGRMEAFGRAGFVRSLQDLGYEKMYVSIGKDL